MSQAKTSALAEEEGVANLHVENWEEKVKKMKERARSSQRGCLLAVYLHRGIKRHLERSGKLG